MKIARIALLVAAALQLVRPSHEHPTVDASTDLARSTKAPPAVAEVLRRACYDCHSYETRWPWYAELFPVSWMVTNDVNHGREALNFSAFGALERDGQSEAYEALGDAVDRERMPLPLYGKMHREARLDARERRLLTEWAEREHQRLNP